MLKTKFNLKFNRTLILCDLAFRSVVWPVKVMVLRWKYLTSTLKDLRKHLVVEHNTLRKESDRERSVHIYIRWYLGRISIERECFCGRGDISRRCTDSYEWFGIVKLEKFHLLSVLRSFFYNPARWNSANISLIENARLILAFVPTAVLRFLFYTIFTHLSLWYLLNYW